MARQTVHDRKRNRPVRPEFTLPQAKALRVAISWGRESEDPTLNKTLSNAGDELDRAQREATR